MKIQIIALRRDTLYKIIHNDVFSRMFIIPLKNNSNKYINKYLSFIGSVYNTDPMLLFNYMSYYIGIYKTLQLSSMGLDSDILNTIMHTTGPSHNVRFISSNIDVTTHVCNIEPVEINDTEYIVDINNKKVAKSNKTLITTANEHFISNLMPYLNR